MHCSHFSSLGPYSTMESLKKNKRKKERGIFTAVKIVYTLVLAVKEELVF